ncbi:ATP-binding protein [Streptomyces ziwulingensis]|uniref:ATP-binding protein n=1 Tax=Streptomyces ziwulingensis TaxID=1045501 RepID=A0ABP9C1H5_9ACTN
MHETPEPEGADTDGSGTGPPEASLALDGNGTRIAEARRLAGTFLAQARDEYGITVPADAVEITQLIVSELVTNARKYTSGPGLLRLRIVGTAVQVEVWDSDPALPTARAANPGRIGQHGLEIVTALARSVVIEPAAVGKRITADIALSPAATGSVA